MWKSEGIPYTLTELQQVTRTQVRDEYHRELMEWAAGRITTLEGLLRRWLVGLQERIDPRDILAIVAETRAAVPDVPLIMPNLREALEEIQREG